LNRLDLSHSPTLLCHFDRTLEDLSGSGIDLIGTATFTELAENHFGLAPGSDVRRAAYDAALDIAGPMTVEVTGYFYGVPSGQHIFASFTVSGESDPTNTQWQLGTNGATQLRWIHERGSTGLDDIHVSTNAIEGLPRPHTRFHAAAVRRADGSVVPFLNGRQHGDPSPAFAAPTGGTSAFLRVMFGSTAFALDGLKITASELTPAQVADSAAAVLGYDPADGVHGTLWVGATTDTTATVIARMGAPVAALVLDVGGVPTAPQATDADNVARFDLTGLAPDTEYTIALPCGVAGKFRTHPTAAGTACDFTIAFGGDADTGSRHRVFDVILELDPLMFIHLGDMHYENNATNSPALFHGAWDNVQAQPPQARLLRNVATAYVWDDHDFGGNNANAASPSKPAACAAYRSRVPHYPLPHATAIYQTWDIGRVRFVMTDQRSESVTGSILGATQKAWLKDILSNSTGMLIVWICPRWFCNANHADSWNSYAAERTEIADHIKANCHGRVIVLEADQHTLAIDDGSHADFATGGGEPLPCFRAAPLDKTVSALAGTYSHGEFAALGQFGTMRVEDSGGSSIDVTWTGRNSSGAVLTTYAFSVNV